MTRRFLDDIKSDMVNTYIEDNSTGNITPSDVRTILTDIIDSTISDEASLRSTATESNYTLSTSWATLASATLYDEETGDDGDFLNVNKTAGTITGSSTVGYSYAIRAGVTLSAVANNQVVYLAIAEGGNPPDFVTAVVGDGGSTPASRYWERFVQTAPADAEFSIIAKNSNSEVVDIDSIVLVVEVLPTNNA